MEIVRDEADRWRFVRLLYMLNDTYQSSNTAKLHKHSLKYGSQTSVLERKGAGVSGFLKRPDGWPEREPLVAILAWTLMPNHFHLLLRETREGGISKFMQRLCGSMSAAFNQKYSEKGSIFQGAFRGRTVDTDEYLRYVLPYIAVKNVLELHQDGLVSVLSDFDSAWEWVSSYPFTSFRTLATGDRSPLISHADLVDLGIPSNNFKQDAHDMLVGHLHTKEEFAELLLEDW